MTKLLTPAEVAEMLQVKEPTIYQWVSRKRIPYIKVNRALRFDKEKIEKWLKMRSVSAEIGGMIV